MIAHRLQTIETAEELLYLEEPNCVVACKKGTKEYADVMKKLKETNYAHQNEDEEVNVKDNEDKPEQEKVLVS